MTKEVSAGTKTMIMPLIMPDKVSGMMILNKMMASLAPRSFAASMTSFFDSCHGVVNWQYHKRKKIVDHPNTTAVCVLSIFTVPNPKNWKIALTIPLLDSSRRHAKILSMKFIHIGRIKMNTTKLCCLIFKPFKIIASG